MRWNTKKKNISHAEIHSIRIRTPMCRRAVLRRTNKKHCVDSRGECVCVYVKNKLVNSTRNFDACCWNSTSNTSHGTWPLFFLVSVLSMHRVSIFWFTIFFSRLSKKKNSSLFPSYGEENRPVGTQKNNKKMWVKARNACLYWIFPLTAENARL